MAKSNGGLSLDQFASPLKAKNHFVKASFGGFAGGGKTKTATDFNIGVYKQLGLTKPVLIIDNENGSRFLLPAFQNAGIDARVKSTIKLADVLTAFDLLESGQIDFLFIDSLSKVWYDYVRGYLRKNNKSVMRLPDWGNVIPAWQSEFSDRFVSVNGCVVFTGRGGFSYSSEKDEETGKRTMVQSGVKMKLSGETPFESDLNVWMEVQEKIDGGKLVDVWREAQILKDRSGVIDGEVFKNPSYSDFKPFVDFIVNCEVGEVAGVSDSSDLAPKEFGDSDGKKRREILLEKIEAEFVKLGLDNRSKDDKMMKVLISESIFQTSSWKEIQLIATDELKDGLLSMQVFQDTFQAYLMACHDEGIKPEREKIKEMLSEAVEAI